MASIAWRGPCQDNATQSCNCTPSLRVPHLSDSACEWFLMHGRDKASANVPPQPVRLQSCFSTDLHGIDDALVDSQTAAAAAALAAVDVHSKESLQQATVAAEQLKHTLYVVEATTFPCAAELGWLQQTVRQQNSRHRSPRDKLQQQQQQATVKQEAAVKLEGGQQQQSPVAAANGSKGQQQLGGGCSSSLVPQWVRCTACNRTVLPLKLAAHQANCARRRALSEKQAAALAAKAASQGRPATPPLSTTSGRSGAGTAAAAAAAAAGRGGSGGVSKSKRSSSYLNPNRSRSPATSGLAAAAAAAGGLPAAAGGLLGSPAGAVLGGVFVPQAGAAGMYPAASSRHRGAAAHPPAAAAAGGVGGMPLGTGITSAPGLVSYARGPGAPGAAAGDMGKPPLPKPSLRAAAAAAAAAADFGGSTQQLQQQQQQAGVHALINPGGMNRGGSAGTLPAGFVPQQQQQQQQGSGRSPSPSSSLPAPALNPDLLAQFGGEGNGFAAGAASSGLSGLVQDHPAAVPHPRRPRSVQPPRYACVCRQTG